MEKINKEIEKDLDKLVRIGLIVKTDKRGYIDSKYSREIDKQIHSQGSSSLVANTDEVQVVGAIGSNPISDSRKGEEKKQWK